MQLEDATRCCVLTLRSFSSVARIMGVSHILVAA